MRSGSIRSKLYIAVAWLIFLTGVAGAETDLTGKWVCNSNNQTLLLEFKPGNVLSYNGQEYAYMIMSNMIIVGDVFDPSVYPFKLEGDALVIDMSAEGSGIMSFKRATEGEFAQQQEQKQVQAGKMSQQLAGKWIRSKGGRQLVLSPDGSFSDYSESSNSGQFNDAWSGENTGNWGAYSSNEARGTWSASGTAEQGTITLTAADGSQSQIQYRVHSENGNVYWNEYWFNGDHFSRQ